MLMKLIIIFITGSVVIQVISEDCPVLGVCVKDLELKYNTTLEHPTLQKSLNFCLSVIKDKDVCISNAQSACALTGTEELYITYLRLRQTVTTYCSDNVCSDLTSIQSCWEQLDYSGIPNWEYSQFCRSVQKCQQRPLTGDACHSTNQIFESQLSADPKKIIQYICNSECVSLNDTVDAVRHCGKSLSSNEYSCRAYHVFVECLQSFPVCPEVNRIVEYFYEGYNELQDRCRATTTTVSDADTKTTANIVSNDQSQQTSTGEVNVDLTTTVPKLSSINSEKTHTAEPTVSKSTDILKSTQSLKTKSSVVRVTPMVKSTTVKNTINTSLDFVSDTTRSRAVTVTPKPSTISITDLMADEDMFTDERRSTTFYVSSISTGMTTTGIRRTSSKEAPTSDLVNNRDSSSVSSTSKASTTVTTNILTSQKATGKTVKVKTGGQTFNENGAVSTMGHRYLVSVFVVFLWVIR